MWFNELHAMYKVHYKYIDLSVTSSLVSIEKRGKEESIKVSNVILLLGENYAKDNIFEKSQDINENICTVIWLQLLLGFTVALHSTEALMAAGFLKSQDLGGPPHGYGAPHPHHSVPHGPLPPGMGMPGLGPFLPHTIDVGFPQDLSKRLIFVTM
uniref:Uncharacterized protein n=1 Tax=Glossina austeni TaxID=7395 RepID=A0A1A9UE11_GLOAU